MTYLLIALGSALGGVARYWMSGAVVARMSGAFPWGTLVVNVLGSFLIGAALALIEPNDRWQLSSAARNAIGQFFMVGVLGGFTTFSAFSVQTLMLLREQQWWLAGANVVASVVICLTAVAWGYYAVYCCVTR